MQLAQDVAEQMEETTKPQNEPLVRTRSTNDLTRAEREELNALSKEVFGASSRWQKLVNKGYSKVITEEVTELVPGEKEGDEPTERKVQVPVKTASGAIQSKTEYYNVDTVKTLMLDLKARRDAYLEAVKKAQEEQKAEQEKQALEKKISEEATGSAGL